jgi:hypothetical protein
MKFSYAKHISIEKTWSCHFSKSIHCGTCIECYTRKEGFYKAGIKDTTKYLNKSVLQTLKSKLVSNYRNIKNNSSLSSLLEINEKDKIYIPHDTIYIINKGYFHLLNKEHEYIVLNKSGGMIWSELTKEPKNLLQLKKIITTEYEVNPNEAYRDIKTLIEYLMRHKFLSLTS